jgi:hypothetical protein
MKIKYDKTQTFPVPRAKFRKDGTNVRDRSDKWTRTKGQWKQIKLRTPAIFSYDAPYAALAEDASRHRAYLASRRI